MDLEHLNFRPTGKIKSPKVKKYPVTKPLPVETGKPRPAEQPRIGHTNPEIDRIMSRAPLRY